MWVRCSKCRGRKTLSMPPAHYVRLPRCPHCSLKMEYDPVDPRTPHWYEDRYRKNVERGRGSRRVLCYPGRGGCGGYSFPHRRGSGYCWHNPNLNEAAEQERAECGAWA